MARAEASASAPNTLLETLLADDRLQQQLARMDGHHHTITLDSGRLVASDSKLRPLAVPALSDLQITLESPPVVSADGGSAAPVPVAGHLPARHVARPGEPHRPETDYRFIGQLGRGGTGIVYQAHQRAIDREVAVKVLRDELLADPVARERFLVEARTIGGLDHPNVIALHELAVSPAGQLFYSMKRVDGTSWNQAMGEQSLEEKLTVLMRVADAIRYAHSRGLVHRDIKPENVMLGRFGEVLVADWGLALPVPVTSPDGQHTSGIGGTPAYMAPEQAAAELTAIGPHTDVYLLGGVLFHILTGHPPHHGETLLECIQAAAANKIRPTRVVGELLDVALQAMATDPAERFPSVEAFQAALHTYQKHQESITLVDRARQHAEAGAERRSYEPYSLAINLLTEALNLWDGNRRAVRLLTSVRTEFARLAASQGDLDLSVSLLEAAGEGESELANRVRRERSERSEQQRRETRFSAIFDSSPDPVLLTDLVEGRVLEMNEMAVGAFGLDRRDVIGKRITELDVLACPQRRSDFVSRLEQHGRVDNFEARLRRGDGNQLDVLISGRRVDLDGQQVVVTVLRDITQRKQAEDELRRSRQRLREVTQLANLGMWQMDVVTGRITWSDESYAIAGLPSQAPAPDAEAYLQMVHPDDRQRLTQVVAQAIQYGTSYRLQLRQTRPDGGYSTVIIRGQAMNDPEGRVVELYGTIQDVTQRHAEQERLRSHAAALQQMIDWTRRPLIAIRRDGRLLAAAQMIRQTLRRESLEDRWHFRGEPGTSPLETIQEPTDVRGRLVCDAVPEGPLLTLRIEPLPQEDELLIAEWTA